MKAIPYPIDVRRYDKVVGVLVENPGISMAEAARQAGVSEPTVKKIWEGSISRPPIIVLERLSQPRRCDNCGALCRDWPCILCEMQRRGALRSNRLGKTGFVYKSQKH